MGRTWTMSRWLLASASLTALSLATPAAAQDAGAEVEEVVITGFRGSLRQA